jgi:hypothetical protein
VDGACFKSTKVQRWRTGPTLLEDGRLERLEVLHHQSRTVLLEDAGLHTRSMAHKSGEEQTANEDPFIVKTSVLNKTITLTHHSN